METRGRPAGAQGFLDLRREVFDEAPEEPRPPPGLPEPEENALDHEERPPPRADEPREEEDEENENVDDDMGGEEWPVSSWSIPRAWAHHRFASASGERSDQGHPPQQRPHHLRTGGDRP